MSRNKKISKKIKDELIGTGVVWFSGFLFGALVAIGAKKDTTEQGVPKRIDSGTYIDWHKTDLTLMAIGINAVNDGVYDEYELQEIIGSSNVN